MRLHQTVMALMAVNVVLLLIAPVLSSAQRGEGGREGAYTVEGISCTLFPENCEPPPGVKYRGLPQRPAAERPPTEPGKPKSVMFHIRFATNSDEIPVRYYAELDQLGQALAESLRRSPQAHIEISGHTDSVGSQSHNQKLSERRATSVKRYLMSKFNIASENLSVKGYGPSEPIAPNNTPEGREQNRRVVAERK
jgi:outer membrane protein OmpA-like peptidoglycan-associated protein